MRGSLTVCRPDNIPIDVQASWLPVFALIIWMLAARFFPQLYPTWPISACWLAGVLTASFLFVSVLIHEFGHVVAARWRGLPVLRVSIFYLGGVAVIDAGGASALDELWLALAGPTATILFTIALAGGCFFLGGLPAYLRTVLLYLALSNGLLAAFNLLPGYPLDGGRILRAVLWQISGNPDRATRWAGWTGQALGIIGLVGGLGALDAGDNLIGISLILVGAFLIVAARGVIPGILAPSD